MINDAAMHDAGMRKQAAEKPARRVAAETPTHRPPPPPPPKPRAQKPIPPPPSDTQNAEEQLVARRKARLRDLIEREGSGGSMALSRRAGMGQSHVNHLSLPGYPFGARAARGLEKQLGLPHNYFDQAPVTTTAAHSAPTVPVLPWADIGRFGATPDAPTISIPWQVGPRAVAGVSHGSMWSGDGGLGIPRGWYAVIDPDLQVREGDVVAVWLAGSTEATLRHYLVDGGRRLLYPLDPRSPAIEEWTRDVTVWGPVVGALKNLRT